MKWNSNVLAIVGLVSVFILYFFTTNPVNPVLIGAKLKVFKTMMISIMLEALPFILLGVFVSALLQVFISERMLQKFIPRNPLLGILAASVLGIVFPICECGMVPVIRRLIQKGMPLYAAVVFILAGPILNPIVFFSTFTAFRNQPEITYSRMALAFLTALVIGLLVYRLVKTDPLKDAPSPQKSSKQRAGKQFDRSDRGHGHGHEAHQHSRGDRLAEWMAHTASEFFEMGKYLMFGSIIAAGLHTFVAPESLVSIGHGPLGSTLLMMALAYLLSLCSTSDAFVASSFMNTFPPGSLVAFLVFGPMLNLKGTLMLAAVFKKRFVMLLGSLVILFVFAGSLLFEWFVLK